MRLLTLLILSTSTQLFAGNISSGGGEFLGDRQNPWFLEASRGEAVSKSVHYCVDTGSDFVVQDRTLVGVVRRVIDWWDQQSSSAHIPENSIFTGGHLVKFFVKLQTSRFLLDQHCDDNTDLKFQFGILTQKQRDALDQEKIDLTKYAGITIREDYTSKMRGKGYIYISPDRGPNAMRAPNIIPDIWSSDDRNRNNILESILRHEMGHVHGLPHTQTGIMDARIPEQLTTMNYSMDGQVYRSITKPVFFPGPADIESCDRTKHSLLFNFFGVSDAKECVGMYVDLNTAKVWVRTNANSSQEFIATKSLIEGYNRRFRDLINVALPSAREVYQGIPEFFSRLKGPGITEVQQIFTLNVNNVERSMFVQRDPDWFQIGGTIDGQVVPDLFSEGSQWKP